MAYQYDDYDDLTGEAQIARLKLHIREVKDSITAEMSGSGRSVSSSNLTQYLGMLLSRLHDLGGASPRGAGRSRVTRPAYTSGGLA